MRHDDLCFIPEANTPHNAISISANYVRTGYSKRYNSSVQNGVCTHRDLSYSACTLVELPG